MPLDHISIYVKDLGASEKFYLEALAPIGYKVFMRYDEHKVIGFAAPDGGPDFWIAEAADKISTGAEFAFKGKDQTAVQAFHAAAVKAGGECNGKPGPRDWYGPGYYAAFVKDLDGHNVEVMIRDPPSA
ncbi:Glyoxalase/Bleomycin resistance protein/Dihydroxybiphenyl dioxygenase [Atractiella rhizophila]|nr:Glyoxalase/Bleomycin resistance protein/Dihydroxybiphenyl dioxygenase [Atractiella rhizophila]